ncbi:hypothetical protein BY458DRAFT_486639 [Sporodiniella umbellata]|nr:hypothetical protein BY458DRAFT_486639 [Sporodiniella umbellata]
MASLLKAMDDDFIYIRKRANRLSGSDGDSDNESFHTAFEEWQDEQVTSTGGSDPVEEVRIVEERIYISDDTREGGPHICHACQMTFPAFPGARAKCLRCGSFRVSETIIDPRIEPGSSRHGFPSENEKRLMAFLESQTSSSRQNVRYDRDSILSEVVSLQERNLRENLAKNLEYLTYIEHSRR